MRYRRDPCRVRRSRSAELSRLIVSESPSSNWARPEHYVRFWGCPVPPPSLARSVHDSIVPRSRSRQLCATCNAAVLAWHEVRRARPFVPPSLGSSPTTDRPRGMERPMSRYVRRDRRTKFPRPTSTRRAVRQSVLRERPSPAEFPLVKCAWPLNRSAVVRQSSGLWSGVDLRADVIESPMFVEGWEWSTPAPRRVRR